MKNFLSLIGSLMAISLLVSCGGGDDAPEPAPTIAAPAVAGLFQPEGEIDVTFTITGTFQTGNSFTAQLSDGTGNFSNPTVIGTLASTTAGTIEATLPASVATGNAYRIRVVATTPATISPDNGSNLSIAAPTIAITNISNNSNLSPGGSSSISFTTTGTFTTGNIFTAQLSNSTGSFSNPTSIGTLNSSTAGTIEATLPANTPDGTSYRIRIVASAPAITSPDNGTNLTIATPTITISSFATSPANRTYVAGRDVVLNITTTGTFASDNQFTIEVSNEAGTFNSSLGSITASALTSRTVTLPANIPTGSGFRFRVKASKPAVNSAFSSTFNVVALAINGFQIGANPNYVAGGNITASFFATNGPFLSNNQFIFQLSDATGSFANPVTLGTTSSTESIPFFISTIPVTTPAGSGYRMRVVSTAPMLTSTVTSAISIGALPTLTLEPGTPTFTKLYSGFLFGTNYTMRITRTGTINPGTTFRLQRINAATGVITEVLLSTTQANELITSGSTNTTVTLVNTGNTALTYTLLANGHAIASNQLQLNATQTGLSSLSANIDTQPFNFSTNRSVFFANSPTGINNQDLLISSDEPTTVFGAASVRMFIGIPLVNENVPTGTVTGRLIVHYLNASGGQIAIYNNGNVSLNISGSPTAYTLSANGPFTLTRTSGTAGNSTISLQFVSASFKMQ
jgi:hypothetical protein